MKHAVVANFIDKLQSLGRYSFSKEEALRELALSPLALIRSLQRLAKKKMVVLVRRGFYVIVPPEYRASGILPPEWFIHDLMQALNKPYYVGVLSAAALHGAAHEQPQAFHVVTTSPQRDIRVAGVHLTFFSKSRMQQTPTHQIKTPTGFITTSTPAATSLDCVRFAARVGGLDRVLTVLIELAEVMTTEDLLNAAAKEKDIAYTQRLGFLLEKAQRDSLADALASWIASRRPLYTPLDPTAPRTGHPYNARWHVIDNAHVEADL